MNGSLQIIHLHDTQMVHHALERVMRDEYFVVDGRRRYLQAIRMVDDRKSTIIAVFGGRWMGGGTQ